MNIVEAQNIIDIYWEKIKARKDSAFDETKPKEEHPHEPDWTSVKNNQSKTGASSTIKVKKKERVKTKSNDAFRDRLKDIKLTESRLALLVQQINNIYRLNFSKKVAEISDTRDAVFMLRDEIIYMYERLEFTLLTITEKILLAGFDRHAFFATSHGRAILYGCVRVLLDNEFQARTLIEGNTEQTKIIETMQRMSERLKGMETRARKSKKSLRAILYNDILILHIECGLSYEQIACTLLCTLNLEITPEELFDRVERIRQQVQQKIDGKYFDFHHTELFTLRKAGASDLINIDSLSCRFYVHDETSSLFTSHPHIFNSFVADEFERLLQKNALTPEQQKMYWKFLADKKYFFESYSAEKSQTRNFSCPYCGTTMEIQDVESGDFLANDNAMIQGVEVCCYCKLCEEEFILK